MRKGLLVVSMLLCVLSGSGWALRQSSSMFLTGKVILDDGMTPPGQGRVELVCNGNVVRQAYISGSGTFSLQVSFARGSVDSQQPMDASFDGPLSGGSSTSQVGRTLGRNFASARYDSLNLSGCELQARLEGFRSDRIILGRRGILDNRDVGIIILHQTVSAEGGTVSVKSLAAPKKARQAYENAGKELTRKKINFSKVKMELQKAVEMYPEFSAAWHLLGETRLELKDQVGARKAFGQAMAADSQYVAPYLSLARLEMEDQQWEKAAQLCSQALELNSHLAAAHYLNALANSSLGNLDVAEKSALRVQKSSQAQDYPATHYILGWIESQKGNFQSAATEYRRFLAIQPTASIADKLKEQLTQWEGQGLTQSSEISK